MERVANSLVNMLRRDACLEMNRRNQDVGQVLLTVTAFMCFEYMITFETKSNP